MSARQLTPARIRRALDAVLQLPPEALADLAARIVDRLDASGPDADLEAEDDACDAEDLLTAIESHPLSHRKHWEGAATYLLPSPDRSLGR